MCIICIKPKGIAMPSEKTIRTMWDNNPDGAGFMYAAHNHVHIDKGYMKVEDYIKALNSAKKSFDMLNSTVILHFRIGTAGGNTPQNTHPFPITDNVKMLQKLHVTTNLGIAHNGIIPIKTSQNDISDTMEFIKSVIHPFYLNKKTFYKSTTTMSYVDSMINNSRMVFLLPSGKYYKLGNWVKDNDTGLIYSNSTYEEYRYRYVYTPYLYGSPWDDDYDDDWLDGWKNEWDGNNRRVSPIAVSRWLAEAPAGSYVVDMDTGNMYDAEEFGILYDAYGDLYYDLGKQSVHGLPYAEEIPYNVQLFNSNAYSCSFDPTKAKMYSVIE